MCFEKFKKYTISIYTIDGIKSNDFSLRSGFVAIKQRQTNGVFERARNVYVNYKLLDDKQLVNSKTTSN